MNYDLIIKKCVDAKYLPLHQISVYINKTSGKYNEVAVSSNTTNYIELYTDRDIAPLDIRGHPFEKIEYLVLPAKQFRPTKLFVSPITIVINNNFV